MIKIDKLRFYCNKILPLVYDDSLSYYEVLCKVADKVNDLITNEEEQNEVITAIVEEMSRYEPLPENRSVGKYLKVGAGNVLIWADGTGGGGGESNISFFERYLNATGSIPTVTPVSVTFDENGYGSFSLASIPNPNYEDITAANGVINSNIELMVSESQPSSVFSGTRIEITPLITNSMLTSQTAEFNGQLFRGTLYGLSPYKKEMYFDGALTIRATGEATLTGSVKCTQFAGMTKNLYFYVPRLSMMLY